MELKGIAPGQLAPPAQAKTQARDLVPGWGLGSDLASLVPCLGDVIGVVGN